jgi:GT2 family glycosyltransferase
MESSQKINKFVSSERNNFIPNKIKVSLIILSWNTKDLLKKCLKSIPFYAEVIVVDNGSKDGTIHFLNSFKWPNLKVIKNKKNLGFAKGNNQGIKAASGDLIMLLNSDTVVEKKAIEKLIDFYQEQENKNLALSPLLLNSDGTLQEEYYMRFPNLWQIFVYHCPFWRWLLMKTSIKWKIISRMEKSPFEVEQLPGAALMAPKEIWEKVGLLDEDYQFLYEDVDWCWRAKEMGVKLMVVPEAKIIHLGGGSWKKRLKSKSFEFYRDYFKAFLLFVKKNYGEGGTKLFRFALLVNFLLRGKFRLFFAFLKK